MGYPRSGGLSILPIDSVPRSCRIYHWSLMLAQYSVSITYVPASENCLKDYISHNPECIV